MTLKGPELRCLLFPDLALAAHFSWEYNTGKPALIPCYVSLIDLHIIRTHKPRPRPKYTVYLSPFVSLCLLFITRPVNAYITLCCWLSFSAPFSLWMPSFMTKCCTKCCKRNKKCHSVYMFSFRLAQADCLRDDNHMTQ